MNTAMILAAGRGERLKPITDNLPKALCSVKQIPVIETHIRRLAETGFHRIIINHAYLGGMIRQHLGDGSRFGVEILYSPEPPGGLETGGGIVNALQLLGTDPFVAVNADIVTNYPFKIPTLADNCLAHMVLVEKPNYIAHADFGLDEHHRLSNNNRQYTYAGIACYHPKMFQNWHIGRYSLTPYLRNLADKNQIQAELYGGLWQDIGSPELLALANMNHRLV